MRQSLQITEKQKQDNVKGYKNVRIERIDCESDRKRMCHSFENKLKEKQTR